MDITVSRLNNRLALQLPAELPLGLVFVVGEVRRVIDPQDPAAGEPQRDKTEIELVEQTHRLRCQLSERAAREISLSPGDRIRAGGHLTFDPYRAEYLLLARDVELLEQETIESAADGVLDEDDVIPSTAEAHPILNDISKRSQTASLAQAELPDWVQQIAPPEVKAEMELTSSELDLVLGPDQKIEYLDSEEDDAEDEDVQRSADQVLAYLADIMDDTEDVELVPEMVTDFPAAPADPILSERSARAFEMPGPSAEDEEDADEALADAAEAGEEQTVDHSRSQRALQARRTQPDLLTIMLIAAVLIFIVAVGVALVSSLLS